MNELPEKLKPLLEELIAEVWDKARDDMREYAAAIAEDFATCLIRSYAQDDEVAQTNLAHLKAQVKLIAVKQRIILERKAMEKLSKALGVVAQIALTALKAAL